jgi:ATP-dependent DNA helicase RecG
MCSDMEPVIRPEIQSHRIDGHTLITAEVPELDKRMKPCYYRSAGYTNGAFVRVSDGNRKLSQYEVHMMLSGRGQPKDDETPSSKNYTGRSTASSSKRAYITFTQTPKRSLFASVR